MPNACYVVLHHEGIPDPHFDIMVEMGSALATWRSPIWPISEPTPLIQLYEHRSEYLTFEGELSNERGRVTRVAAGRCEFYLARSLIVRLLIEISRDSTRVHTVELRQLIPDETWQATPID